MPIPKSKTLLDKTVKRMRDAYLKSNDNTKIPLGSYRCVKTIRDDENGLGEIFKRGGKYELHSNNATDDGHVFIGDFTMDPLEFFDHFVPWRK